MVDAVFLLLIVSMSVMSMEEMHEWTSKNEDERRVGKNVLPVIDERDDHDDGKDVVEPMRDAEIFHAHKGVIGL